MHMHYFQTIRFPRNVLCRNEKQTFMLVCDELHNLLEPQRLMKREQRDELAIWIGNRNYADEKNELVNYIIECFEDIDSDRFYLRMRQDDDVTGSSDEEDDKGDNEDNVESNDASDEEDDKDDNDDHIDEKKLFGLFKLLSIWPEDEKSKIKISKESTD